MRSCSMTRMIRPGRRILAGRFLLSWIIAGSLLLGRATPHSVMISRIRSALVGTPLTPAEERMKADVTFLAADARDGRAPGTQGDRGRRRLYRRRLQRGRPQARAGANGYFQPFSISGRPTLGAEQELALTGPDGKKVKGELKPDFSPLAVGVGATLDQCPHRLRRLWHHGQRRRSQARLRRLRGDRRQGQGRPPDPARASAGGRRQSVRRQKNHALSPRFSTRRPTRFSTVPSRSCWSTTWPAWGARKTSCFLLAPAAIDANSNLPFVMLTRDFADKLLIAAGEPPLSRARKRDRPRLEAAFPRAEGLVAQREDRDRAARDRDQERGRRSGRGRTARRRDGRDRRPLRPSGPRRNDCRDHWRSSRSDIHNGADDNASGTVHGARAGTPAGCPPRPAAAPGRLHRVLGRGKRAARARSTMCRTRCSLSSRPS